MFRLFMNVSKLNKPDFRFALGLVEPFCQKPELNRVSLIPQKAGYQQIGQIMYLLVYPIVHKRLPKANVANFSRI
jgi:hypothetical protein